MPRRVLILLCVGILGCGSATEPGGVRLDIAGTVQIEGTQVPVSGARVVLIDRRSSLEAGHVLASAITDAIGSYQLAAEAKRPGYLPGCEFVLVFVEGYEYTSGKFVECTSQRQVINLTLTPQ